ncbi:MAG: hypothetical protein COA99_11115 [Moraxellaceae bacterium]|nr:MAG: hypothetical protein COA99_11115 [Moraxellaceae bacterium]
MEFHYARVDIQQLFHDVIAFVVTEAYDKGLDVGVVQESALPQFILADAVKLRQVLLILLANAVKFTGHGSILLWAEMLSQGRLYIEIRDTGVGISKEKQDEIFQPFTQEDASTTRHFEGSGLGLALCQRLVEAMGGSVGVRSIQGVGSSFFIELSVGVIDESKNAVGLRRHDFSTRCPASSALLIGDLPGTKTVMKITCQQWGVGFHWEPKESRVLRHLDEILHADNYRWIFIAQEMSERFWEQMNPYLNANDGVRVIQLRLPNETYGQRPLPHLYVPFTQEALANLMLDIRVEERLMSGGLKNATVSRTHLEATLRKNFPRMLVVDDNLVNRKIVCGFLKKMGFKTDVVGDGAQAVEAVKSNTYGMVFMDCQMPVMDGYEATRQIRKHFSSEVLPILAVTANALKGDREKCLAAGMDDYIAKPLQMDEMASKINFWVDKFHSKAQSKA